MSHDISDKFYLLVKSKKILNFEKFTKQKPKFSS